jgi:hypothetical protein
MKLKIGDKVKYITKDFLFSYTLILGETYIVDNIFGDNTISVEGSLYTYSVYNFITIKEERKQKLKKICSNKEIK